MLQFQNKGWKKYELNLMYKDQVLSEANEISFLGITLDHQCNWKAHVDKICSKINRFAYALWRLTKISN